MHYEATQVGHAMNMAAELPRYTGDESIPTGAQVGCLDAFFLNLKLLARDLHVMSAQSARIGLPSASAERSSYVRACSDQQAKTRRVPGGSPSEDGQWN
jgi:hypothetical protein